MTCHVKHNLFKDAVAYVLLFFLVKYEKSIIKQIHNTSDVSFQNCLLILIQFAIVHLK